MDARYLFLRTLADLEQRITVGDDYELLRASLLLRQLLLDAQPLVHAVNREHRRPLTFVVGKMVAPEGVDRRSMMMWSLVDGIDASGSPSAPSAELKLDAFLHYPVLGWSGIEFTIHDVIDVEAHVSGGVHLDEPTGEKLAVLDALTRTSMVFGHETARALLRPISRVVLRGVAPLADDVREDLKSRPPPRQGMRMRPEEFIAGLDKEALGFLREVAERSWKQRQRQ